MKALVDIELVLGNVKSYETRLGEWVHVVGYICAPKQSFLDRSRGAKKEIPLQAIVIWSAGPLKLDEYEKLQDRLRAERLASTKNEP